MGSVSINLTSAGYSSDVITSYHLGANVVFTKDYLDAGGPFDRFLNQLQIGFLRLPGGTVTEQLFAPGSAFTERFFSTTRPSGLGTDGEARIVTLGAAFGYAQDQGAGFAITLPTNSYFSDEVDADGNRVTSPFGLYRLIDRVDSMIRGDYGDVKIDLVQIGNEFWYRGERQSAEEYGRMANDLAIGLQRIFNIYRAEDGTPSDWVEPKIAIQVAQGWKPQDNATILDALTPEARAAIDTLTQHYYPKTYGVIQNFQGPFDRLDEIAAADGFGPVDYYLSEWNVEAGGADTGLLQTSTMLEITRTFLQRGVDQATIWGTQYLNLKNRLSELVADPDSPSGFDYRLTPAGEMYRMMTTSLQGLRVLDMDTDAGLRALVGVAPEDRPDDQRDQLVLHAFGSKEKAVFFISSRSDTEIEVAFDPSGHINGWHHLYGQSLGVIDDPATARDEGDPTSHLSRPYMQYHNSNALVDGKTVKFTLGAYEVMKLEFSIKPQNLVLMGHDQIVDPDADYDDDIFGGSGDDVIFGFHGNDRLRGGLGDDILHGGDGDDILFGGEGDDLLISGNGRDVLRGGKGDDVLVAGKGETFMEGNLGRNDFIVDTEGDAIILDFNADNGDTLSFMRHYDSADAVMKRATVQDDDIVIMHDDGGMTELTGAAAQFDRLQAALSDFMEDSPVKDIVDALLAPVPDGSIAEDPEDPHDGPDPMQLRGFEALLNANSSADILAILAEYDDDDMLALVEGINPNALFITAPDSLELLLAAFDDDARDIFFDKLSGEAAVYRLRDVNFAKLWRDPDHDTDIIDRILGSMDAENGDDLFAGWSDRKFYTLLDTLEMRGLDTRDYDVFSNHNARIERLLNDPNRPPFGADEEDEPEDDEDDSSGFGDCFIAGCAYGDATHPDVEVLRMVRDLYLIENRAGRAFIRFYYRNGPRLAARLADYPHLRRAIRGMLHQLVAAILRYQRRMLQRH